MRRVRLSRVLSVALSVVVGSTGAIGLAGCGVVESDLHPGVAASVGDWSITTRDLDELTTDVCHALLEASPGAQAPDLADLRLEVLNALVRREVADAVGADVGVSIGTAYREDVREISGQLAGISDEEHRDALLRVLDASRYAEGLVRSLGIDDLGEPTDGAPTHEELDQAGQARIDEWLAEHDVELNPRYGVDVSGGGLTRVDTALAVGEPGEAVGSSGDCG